MKLVTGVLAVAAALTAASPASAKPKQEPTYSTTKVLVGECLFREGSGESAIGAALLTFGIEKAINLVSGALSIAGQDKATTYYGTGNFDRKFEQLNKTCVIIIKGRFVADVRSIDNLGQPEWASAMQIPGGALKTLARQHRTVLADRPDFMFEAVFNKSLGGTAYTLRPLYAALNSPEEKPALNFSGGRRHVALMLSLVPPGAAFDASSNPGAEIILGQLRPGSPLLFRFPASSADKTQYRSWPQESRWFTMDAAKINGPITVRAVVTETRSGSALAKFLGEALEAAKPALKEELETELIPSRRRAAQIADLEAEATLANTYATALQKAYSSLNACAISSATGNSFDHQAQRMTLSQTARNDQEAANRAAIAASQRPPFSTGQLVTLSANATLLARCRTLRDQAMTSIAGVIAADNTALSKGGVPQDDPPES